MSDFLSINPAPETVTINGKKVAVYGISMLGFGMLMPRFPNLVNDLNERMKKDGMSLTAIIEVAGPAIGPILAAGLGCPGNEEVEKRCEQYSLSIQTDLLDKIVEKTLPQGFGPFVETWATLMARFTAPPTRKLRFKILPKESNPLSAASDIPLTKSGA